MLSVVIPTLNERDSIEDLLLDLRAQKNVTYEVIISDGGSRDGTKEVVENFPVKWVCAEKGRAKQMNHALKFCSFDIVFFLHADSRILENHFLKNALDAFLNYQIKFELVAGHFSLRFFGPISSSFALYHFEQKSKENRTDSFNGDQGLILNKKDIISLGGFNESFLFLEDQGFSKSFKAIGGTLVTLPGLLNTSDRRFESEGVKQRIIFSALIMAFYNINWDPFFKNIEDLYIEQHKSGHLSIVKFFNSVWQLLMKETLRKKVEILLALGRYVRINAWQIGFFLENLLSYYFGLKTRRVTKFFDQYLKKILNFLLFDILSALLMLIWFFSTWFIFFIKESKWKR